MKLSAIIPVKTFSNAKSRLILPDKTREQLCEIMLQEILHTLSISSSINSVIIVSKDQKVFDISKKFDVVNIKAKDETGVNDAIALADNYLSKNQSDASIVLPQDIPFIKTQDIDFLLRFQNTSSCILIVPSRKFDGTNALLRMPTDLMKTYYDEDSYKIHMDIGKHNTKNTSLVFIKRIMMDIDNNIDLEYCIRQNEKPDFCEKIKKLLE